MDLVMGGHAWPLSELAIDYVAAVTGSSGQSACLQLQKAMLDGDVRARGPLGSANAVSIEPEFWRFNLPDYDGGAGRDLHWFEVNAPDVQKRWPLLDVKASKVGTPLALTALISTDFVERPHKQGRRPHRTDEVTRHMKEDLSQGRLTAQDLYDHTETLLSRQYNANRQTVRNARQIVLDGLKPTNSDN